MGESRKCGSQVTSTIWEPNFFYDGGVGLSQDMADGWTSA